jgi:hypothetical protein
MGGVFVRAVGFRLRKTRSGTALVSGRRVFLRAVGFRLWKARADAAFGRRDAFFWALRYEMSRYPHTGWTDFLLTIAGQAPDDS